MHLSGCIEQIGMYKKFSQVFSVGTKHSVTPGTSLSNCIQPQFLIFHIGPLNERTDQIESLMCINDDIKTIQQWWCDYGLGLKTVIYHVFMSLPHL